MKALQLTISFLTIYIFTNAQLDFLLKGHINNAGEGFIFFNYQNESGKSVQDSFWINADGNFLFRGKISGPTMSSLYFGKVRTVDDPHYTVFFIDPGAITVQVNNDNFKDAIITGSNSQLLYEQVEKKKRPIYAKLNEISAEVRKETDKEKAASIREKMVPYTRQLDSIDYQFFAENPSTYVTAYLLRYHIADFSWQVLEGYYNKLGSELQQTNYGKYIKQEIENLKAGSPGALAADFSKTDINGNNISLSQFRGSKYVLIDFWASWCVPCRKGNPHLKEIYAKYNDKGLEIIGVSDDDNKPENWKQAVEKDGLPWYHVLRGLDWNKLRQGIKSENDLSEKFGIHELPTKILIDKNGIIIGRFYEYDEELDAKLKEIFGS
jgi:thiol-disulfide isomerase/thioredoxin